MNEGADAGDGHIVGVIHEMFLVDGNDFIDRDGGAHNVFKGTGREILIAGGNDLQERKRLLVEGAEALIVLPGGPGTWDEVSTLLLVLQVWIPFVVPAYSKNSLWTLLLRQALGNGLCSKSGLDCAPNCLCLCKWLLR